MCVKLYPLSEKDDKIRKEPNLIPDRDAIFGAPEFRKDMGLPKKTSFEAIICDASVLKQSYNCELECTKLMVKLDINICPKVVKKQFLA